MEQGEARGCLIAIQAAGAIQAKTPEIASAKKSRGDSPSSFFPSRSCSGKKIPRLELYEKLVIKVKP